MQNMYNYFGSQLGVSVISEIVTQIVFLRFSVCRNLLILQQIALCRPELLDCQSLISLKSYLTPRTVVLTQAYFTIMWICECSASLSSPPSIL